MPTFHYEALNAERQPVSGQLEADAVQDAVLQLESRGLKVQSIGLVPLAQTPPAKAAPAASRSVGKPVESEFLRTHLTTVLERGKSLIPALRALANEVGSGARRRELNTLIQILEEGDANEAEKAFAQLPEYWIPLLSAALSSNDPG